MSAADFSKIIDTVFPFAEKLKADMLRQHITRGRRKCPLHPNATDPVFVRARIVGSRNHLHMGCDDPTCIMRLAE